MKHSREQLDGMSDFDLNKLLASKVLNCHWHADGNAVIRKTASQVIFTFNDWNDIMPLAVEYGVNVDFESHNKPSAFKGRNIDPLTNDEYAPDFIFLHDNPKRAIACCLIMVLEAKNG